MAKTYLETNTVNHNFETYSYENVLKELENNHDEEGKRLLQSYPDTFPALYAIKNRHLDEDAKLHFREIPTHEREIVTEAWDVAPKDKEVELQCELDDGGNFGITVEPFDQAGENQKQLRARINFSQQTLDELNAARMKSILEFCEKHGLGIWDIEVPYKDGVIDVDEKLATLTRDFLQQRHKDNIDNPGPSVSSEDSTNYAILTPQNNNLEETLQSSNNVAKSKKIKTLESIREDFIEFLEKDLHRTRNRSYFEQKQSMNGRKTYVFSIYDKPNKDNLKEDGREDKNGNHVPTYQYRLYVSQDSESGQFYFGFATPGGKKIDDAMAGDLIGLIKKTGATHINFSNLHNLEKGVWLTACAEKGIIPIGISINTVKAKSMVEAAKKKLTTEELVAFKYNLAEQMVENAAQKCKDKNDKSLGLSQSEWAYIESLRAGYDFENFRLAYEDSNGLYNAVLEQIDKGSKDEKTGAAITFGGMYTLRTVFDIYNQYQHQTFGDYLQNMPKTGNKALTDKERETLSVIPASKKLTDFSVADFRLLYDTLLPRHIQNSKAEILKAFEREDSRKGPKRASNVVLSSDLFPKYKGAVNEINTILTHSKGLDALTLPTEHKGLEFMRIDNSQNNTPAPKTPEQKHVQSPQNIVQNGRSI